MSDAGYWTLRFEDPGVEAGFVKQRSARLVSYMSVCLVCICIPFAFGLLADLTRMVPGSFDGTCDVSPTAESVYLISCYCLYGLIVAFLIMLNVPRLLRRTSPIQRERLAVLFFCISMVWMHILNPFYLAKLFGGNLHNDCTTRQINSPDMYIVLVIVNALAASHLTVPIRWLNLIFLEGVTLATNAFCLFGLGSAEGFDRSVLHFFLLSSLVFILAVGKRNTERAERSLYGRLLSEKTLRTQAEFELSRIQSDSAANLLSQNQDSPSTTPTERAFQDVGLEGLGNLIEIGHREQWLIDAEEVYFQEGDTLLGHGGFGMAVSASFNGSPVAVKAPLQKRHTELSLAAIGNELRILRRLRHAHIILCHGAVIESGYGELALVLELVRGQSMDDFIDGEGHGGQMPSCDARCQCLLGICRALVYIHSRRPRVVHGDLKCSNIMVQRLKGSPAELEVAHAKILDFGIARVLTQRAKPLGGTVRWKAPELFNKPAAKPDPAADVYSFGCLLFFAVSGKRPLEDMGKKTIKVSRRLGVVLTLQWPEDTPMIGQCEEMAFQATLIDPRRRPSMQDIYNDLVQWPEVRQSHGRDYGFLHDMANASPEGSHASQQFWRHLRQFRNDLAQFRNDLAQQDPTCVEQPQTPAAAAAAATAAGAAAATPVRPTSIGWPAAVPEAGSSHVAGQTYPDDDERHPEPVAPSSRVRPCMEL